MDDGPDTASIEGATSAPSAVPIVIGQSGLMGRSQQRPVVDDYIEEDDWAPEPSAAVSVPSPCRRLLAVPYKGDGAHECDPYCQGRQRSGGCLCDLIRAASARGVSFDFEIDPEGYWKLVEKR